PRGHTLFVTAEESARTKVFAVDAATGKAEVALNEHSNSSVTVIRGAEGFLPPRVGALRDQLVYLQDSLTGPAEVWTSQSDGTSPYRLTHVNDERVQLAQMSQPDEFHFEGAQGDDVQAWIMKPVGFESGKKYPVAFIIHGGPQGAISDHFHYRWNLQA